MIHFNDRPRHSYDGDLMKKGAEAENIVMEWLDNHPKVTKVEDARHVLSYQNQEIDAVVHTDTTTFTVEIKLDTYMDTGGNVLYEMYRVYHDKGIVLPGWSFRSKADMLLIYAPKEEAIFRCFFLSYRKKFTEYARNNDYNHVRIESDDEKITQIVLIPYWYCEDIFTFSPLKAPYRGSVTL